MKRSFYSLVTLLTLGLIAQNAQSAVSCMGETHSGTVVRVDIETLGTMGAIRGGSVNIFQNDGNHIQYALTREDIPQFFESHNTQKATVGLNAYKDAQYNVHISYRGRNIEDDVGSVLSDRNRRPEDLENNLMKVWAGSGSHNNEYVFHDVLCSVSLDP